MNRSHRPRARQIFADPAFFQLGGREHRHPGKAAGYLSRPVRRVVIHHDQLPVAAQFEGLIGLAHERLQAGGKAAFLVARRDDDGQLQQLARLRLGLGENRS